MPAKTAKISLNKARAYLPEAYKFSALVDTSNAVGPEGFISLYQAIQLLVREYAAEQGQTENRLIHLWPFYHSNKAPRHKVLTQQVCYGIRKIRVRRRTWRIRATPKTINWINEIGDAADLFDTATTALLRYIKTDRKLLRLIAPTCRDMHVGDIEKSFLSSYPDQLMQTGVVLWGNIRQSSANKVQSPPPYLTAFINKRRLVALLNRAKVSKRRDQAKEILNILSLLKEVDSRLPNGDVTFEDLKDIVIAALLRSEAWGHRESRSDEWLRKHFVRPLRWERPSGPRKRGTPEQEEQRRKILDSALAYARKQGASRISIKR